MANGFVSAAEPLPVRTRCSDAELAILGEWMDDHGDPADWTPKVRAGYAAAVAAARAEGRL